MDAKAKEGLRIILICIGLSIAYGIPHDQISVRICPEYLTEWHEKLVNTDNPTLVALAFGVAATWWVGAALGILMAMAAQLGPFPVVSSRRVLWVVVGVLLLTALCSAYGAWWAAGHPTGRVTKVFADAGLAPELQHRFGICYWMHTCSYYGGALFGVMAVAGVWIHRFRLHLVSI